MWNVSSVLHHLFYHVLTTNHTHTTSSPCRLTPHWLHINVLSDLSVFFPSLAWGYYNSLQRKSVASFKSHRSETLLLSLLPACLLVCWAALILSCSGVCKLQHECRMLIQPPSATTLVLHLFVPFLLTRPHLACWEVGVFSDIFSFFLSWNYWFPFSPIIPAATCCDFARFFLLNV